MYGVDFLVRVPVPIERVKLISLSARFVVSINRIIDERQPRGVTYSGLMDTVGKRRAGNENVSSHKTAKGSPPGSALTQARAVEGNPSSARVETTERSQRTNDVGNTLAVAGVSLAIA